MPSKFRVKSYTENGCYHIYNRGIDGREIFGDEDDYREFVNILKRYLIETEDKTRSIYKTLRPYIIKRREQMNLKGEVELLAMSLLPDHFHLLIWQQTADGIKKLMRRTMTYYSMYYNRKYFRSGPLFENTYRAVKLEEGDQVLLVSKYIHTSVASRQIKRFGLVETSAGIDPEYYMYSTYGMYLEKDTSIIVPEMVGRERLNNFLKQSDWGRKGMSYKDFVEEPVNDWGSLLPGLLIEKL